MEQPAAKKRRLAPKVEAQASPPPSHFNYEPPSATAPVPEPVNPPPQDIALPPPPERHEFESFARHLQDAAMLIYRQTQKAPYSNVSVLMLRWQGNDISTPESDIAALEHVLRARYRYSTHRYDIPAVPNPSLKLGIRISAFLEDQSPGHLYIVFYAGDSVKGPDGETYWISNAREDGPKIKWKGVRCLFEECPSDVLFLLDTNATREEPIQKGTSVKDVLAAGVLDGTPRRMSSRSFTAQLTDAFIKLDSDHLFTSEHLFHEVAMQRHHELLSIGLPNGTSKVEIQQNQLPVMYKFAMGWGQSLILLPLPPTTQVSGGKAPEQDAVLHPSSVAGLTFEEARVLVCTTFVGEASPDMSSFNKWLHNNPGNASSISVEGMFLGPPTMLLISMPILVWNVVQHDKVCCFLGYVNSHNMTHLYERLLKTMAIKEIAPQPETNEAPQSTPLGQRYRAYRDTLQPETPIRSEARAEPRSLPRSEPSRGLTYTNSTSNSAPKPVRTNFKDTAEMQEAAEQLKALSHVRHLSDDAIQNGSPVINSTGSENMDTSMHDETPSKIKAPRRSLTKQLPRQETRCDHCSHAPFKDTSSLRKHIAAAHTRPFPCAFSFAGCTSTFGSKNEWKRHIASQHLCLNYYRCTACPQGSADGKGNEFNRKDLFTQHLRRMHAPFAIKKSLTKGDSKLQMDWETHVKEMQQSCLVIRRRPPIRSACPKPDCASVFEGPTSWDEWTEHVGRHMEKGEADRMGVDKLLADWALKENVIERRVDGEFRLVSGMGSSPTEASVRDKFNHITPPTKLHSPTKLHDRERGRVEDHAARADGNVRREGNARSEDRPKQVDHVRREEHIQKPELAVLDNHVRREDGILEEHTRKRIRQEDDVDEHTIVAASTLSTAMEVDI